MMPRGLLPLTLVALCFGQDPTPPRIGRVEHGLAGFIEQRMAHYQVPGVSLAVITNNAIEWTKGYGYRDREHELPVDTQTMFEAGSISKPVAAMGALWLVEQHKLNLDEQVNDKLKSWKVPDSDFTIQEKVTLRRLLSHSAGLTVHGFPGYEAGSPLPTLPQVLDGVKPSNTLPVRVDIAPGAQWRYSGGGYTVMQLLVTDVTGRPFPAFMAEAVLRKIGMDRSTYEQPLPPRLAGNAATAYAKGVPLAGKYHTYPEMAAAGLWTTSSDLARFGIEVMKSAQGKSNRVLKEVTTREMLKTQSDHYGLGFSLDGNPNTSFGHGGVDAGFEAMLICFPATGQGAVVMTNAQGGTALANEILRSIAAEYSWPKTSLIR